MKLFVILLNTAIFATAYHLSDKEAEKNQIVGGNYTDITQVPYQATLHFLTYLQCGATIISEYWLVTAAHCIDDVKSWSLTVRTGETETHAKLNRQNEYQVDLVIKHPDYDKVTTDNDIGLVKLWKPITFNKQRRAIGIAKRAPVTGDKMKISGFGKEGEFDKTSPVVKVAEVKVIPHEVCKKRYTVDPITSNMFCAGSSHLDACQGDSGGPGVIDNKLAGIISFGIGCGHPRYPGVYTRVDKYYDWIAEKTGLDLSKIEDDVLENPNPKPMSDVPTKVPSPTSTTTPKNQLNTGAQNNNNIVGILMSILENVFGKGIHK